MKQPNLVNKIGIFGAGQLARLLCVEAQALGMQVAVLASDPMDPAAQIADFMHIAQGEELFSEHTLQLFMEGVDIAIFENEFLPLSAFEVLENQFSDQVLPRVATMRTSSNKSKQKDLFSKLSVPTARFKKFDIDVDPKWVLEESRKLFPDGFILKWAKGGYDGYGVKFVKSDQAFAEKEKILEFISKCLESGNSIYSESLVNFETEVALVATRTTAGDFAFYPLVETIQEDGICRIVRGPFGSREINAEAQKYCRIIGEALEIVGTFAIEFFVTESGLIVNELAPRVHNSGHCTLDSAKTNQFKNHILATCRGTLGEVESIDAYSMINLLGPQGVKGDVSPPPIDNPSAKIYWYQKSESRPGRKMGHLNIFGSNAVVDELQDQYLDQVKAWERRELKE